MGYRLQHSERLERRHCLSLNVTGIEEFSREKLLNGLAISRKLAWTTRKYREWNRTFHQPRGRNEVFIGEMVMDHLAKIDDIVYIRFASVYRQFTDRKI